MPWIKLKFCLTPKLFHLIIKLIEYVKRYLDIEGRVFLLKCVKWLETFVAFGWFDSISLLEPASCKSQQYLV